MQQPTNSEATSLYPNNIGWWIKRQGYTQEEVADEIGIARRTLSNYIAGKRVAPRYCLENIAKTIGCEIEDLTLPSEHQSSPSLRKVSELQQEIVSAQDRDKSTSTYQTQLLGPNGVPLQISVHIHQQTATPTNMYLEKNAIIDDSITNTSGQEHPSRIEDTVNRRKFLRGAAATVIADDLLIAELLDR